MKSSPYWLSIILGVYSHLSFASPESEQQSFIDLMVNRHHFERGFIENTFNQATKNPEIIQAIKRPWEAKPWYQYYPIFLTEKRLQKGLEFWRKHQQALIKAEQESGVPAQIIVAIIGVETFYGSYLGKYSVLDALFTLSFYYPPRSTFFKGELEELFLLAQEENFDLSSMQGSYAGAMGWGQFIPSSYRAYAVDFDQDGQRDLLSNPVDAIGSVANYFKRHGWKKGQAVVYQIKELGTNSSQYVTKKLKLTDTWQTLMESGVTLNDSEVMQVLAPETPVKLIEFQQSDRQEYWLALNNFYTITRYNHSPLYAMAVYQFSQQLLLGRQSDAISNAPK